MKKSYLTFSALAFWISAGVVRGAAGVAIQSPGFAKTNPGFQEFYLIFVNNFLGLLVLLAVGYTATAVVSWLKAGFRALRAS